MRKIPMSIDDSEFDVTEPVLKYVAGLNPQRLWELRGLRGDANHEQKTKQFVGEELSKAFLQGGESSKLDNIKSFVNDAYYIFRNLKKRKFTSDKNYWFIIGIMRSGGTFITSEMYKALGLKLEHYSPSMIHDGLPLGPYLRKYGLEDSYSDQLLFEFAEWLNWVNREISGSVVVKKRIFFCWVLPLLDKIFGQNARYVITVRHPLKAANSFKEKEDIKTLDQSYNHPGWKKTVLNYSTISQDKWNNYNFYEQFLHLWLCIYEKLLQVENVRGKSFLLDYEEGYTEFLRDFSGQFNESYEPVELSYRNRQAKNASIDDSLRELLMNLEKRWNDSCFEFPEYSESISN